MKVDDILKAKGRDVSTTSPDTVVIRVAQRLRLERIGALVVSGDGHRVEGIITERDIVVAIARHGADALGLHAADVMTRSVRSCSPDDRVRDVMVEMTSARVRHLAVVEHGMLCGIVSIGDVVKTCLDDADLEVRVLRDAYLGHR
jgi:signal-transduction protein with cAMP-binding, CBS, and nucleotidyltransferase domain